MSIRLKLSLVALLAVFLFTGVLAGYWWSQAQAGGRIHYLLCQDALARRQQFDGVFWSSNPESMARFQVERADATAEVEKQC